MTIPTLRDVWGWLLLLGTYAFLWVGFAAALLLFWEGGQGYIAVGTACVLAAGAAYAARVNLEDGQWERLYMSVLMAALAGVFALYGIAYEEKMTALQVLLRLSQTLVVGCFLAFICTLVHLRVRK